MLANIRNVLVGFAVGVIVGLVIRNVTDRGTEPESARASVGGDAGAIPAPPSPANAAAPIERDAALAPKAPDETPSAATASELPGATAATDPVAAQQPPIPSATLSDDIKARPAPLSGLLNASSLRCDIEVAHGANWAQGKATPHAISYQGGPFSLESIDLEAGTAMMSGGSGVTGSLSGELEMRTTAGNKGLTFSAFTRHGDLLLVNVYSALDASGRYRTVMSTFGDQFEHETAQFFGACDISLARR